MREVPPTEVNVRSTTTASDTWRSCYLVVDQTLGTLLVLVHIIVTIKKNFADRTKPRKFIKIFYVNYF